MSGKVYLIGAGPGDPALITLRGLEILRQADVVIYDYLVDKRILDAAKEDAELISCDTLGKKRYSDGFAIDQERINSVIVKKAKENKNVVRLKNGDASIFSRLSRELDALVKNKIEFEVIPGVTAASAASAFSGIPLTDRRYASSCVFVTGHEDPKKKESALDWNHLSKSGTIVLYMAIANLNSITNKLIENGKDKDTPVAIIENAGLLNQRVTKGTLRDITQKAKAAKVKPPAIIIIGQVVGLGKKFDWFKKTRRILFTGLSKERYFMKGERYLHLPLIRIEPMKDYSGFDAYLKTIGKFDWVVFSSRYGVKYFFERLAHIGGDIRDLSDIKVAAIGSSTKMALLDFGIAADLVPKVESSEGLIREFEKVDIKGKRIFLPRSDISDKNLSDAFGKLGAVVTTSFAYRNVMVKELPELNFDLFDEIAFTSPSGVRAFLKRYKRLPKGIKVRCIGDVTLKEAKRCHFVH